MRCRAANSSVWRWPARWRRVRTCLLWTSRFRPRSPAQGHCPCRNARDSSWKPRHGDRRHARCGGGDAHGRSHRAPERRAGWCRWAAPRNFIQHPQTCSSPRLPPELNAFQPRGSGRAADTPSERSRRKAPPKARRPRWRFAWQASMSARPRESIRGAHLFRGAISASSNHRAAVPGADNRARPNRCGASSAKANISGSSIAAKSTYWCFETGDENA